MKLFSRPGNKSAIQKKVLVYATARSGTNLFINLINQHSKVKLLGEIYSHSIEVPEPNSYLKEKESEAERPVFGFKLLTYQLLEQFDDPAAFMKHLVNEGYQIIHIKRDNVLKLALSRLNALEKKQYHFYKGKPIDHRFEPLKLDIPVLLHNMRRIEAYHKREADLVQPYKHLFLNYERDLEDEGYHQQTMDKVYNFLDIRRICVKARIVKSIPLEMKDYVLNYEEMRKAIMGTPFEKYLPEE